MKYDSPLIPKDTKTDMHQSRTDSLQLSFQVAVLDKFRSQIVCKETQEVHISPLVLESELPIQLCILARTLTCQEYGKSHKQNKTRNKGKSWRPS
jgi:hypothetical protein